MKKNKKIFFEKKIIKILKTIYDPEIPVDIYELGLIYDVKIDIKNNVDIIMTLTSPNCPVAEMLIEEVKNKIEVIDGIKNVNIHLTFNPIWTNKMMSEKAKFDLGMI
ncbi:iron-sulfur cluster assembly protein [Candidatus Shikimatogenerans silvanidophilus]|uniref:iron-sulfur cluster assembly protein n=1 Tax=Candidatus Shikimatogenerans silvanidophilus TaxID=2782547 RepID=UPI001BA5F0CF|nr:iron-sulfur cluster assembly protein [Candidatus Shikimatogenerans silvanidophilus]